MTMTIQIQIRTVYGNERIYPICDKAKVFARLVGQSTLTRADIAKIKELGFAIEQVQLQVAL